MKILMIHNYYQQRGGEDAVFESETELLKEHGHQVETLTFHNDDIESGMDKLRLAFTLNHNTQSAARLIEKLDAFQPDVIHVHNFFPLGSPALFTVARERCVPVVMTLHNFRLICPNALLFRNGGICEDCVQKQYPLDGVLHGCYRGSRLQTAALAWMTTTHKQNGTWRDAVTRYITLTDFARNRFMDSSLKLNEQQVVVKPNFVFDYGEGQPEREPHVLFIGRLSQEKGIDALLEAFQETGRRLKIIGGGPYEAQVRAAADAHEHIEYLGFQEKQGVLEALKQASALVFPSVWYEGFPMTLAESLSTGTPAIVSNIGGLSEIIEDGYNGLHIRPGNASDIREQVDKLLTSPELQQQLGRGARARYLERYTPEVNYENLISIYEHIT